MKQKHTIHAALERILTGYGAALLITLCVAVIACCALWARGCTSGAATGIAPADATNAAALWQQSLSAITPSPLPTDPPLQWCAPLVDYDVIRGFSVMHVPRTGVSGLWEVHPAVDLSAPDRTPVAAMADGVVSASGADDGCGFWVEITHEDGYVSRYASLSLPVTFSPGERIRRSQTIGLVGNTHPAETDLGPHLHLQLTRQGEAIDPLSLVP